MICRSQNWQTVTGDLAQTRALTLPKGRVWSHHLPGILGVLGALSLGFGLGGAAIALASLPVRAGTCASQCGPRPIRFEPGSRVEVEVVNQTASLLLLEDVAGSDPIPVAPSRNFRLIRRGGTVDNSSVVFWDSDGFPLQVQVKQPQENLLRIEVLPAFDPPGDRSVYLRDDGSIAVL